VRRARKQSVLVGLQVAFPQARFFHLDRRDLDHIVDVLNEKGLGKYDAQPTTLSLALSRLIERLKKCDGNLQKMMNDDPELADAVAKVCVTRWMPSTNRRADLVLQPSAEIQALSPTPDSAQKGKERAELLAALLFHVGTLNPEWDKLAGPCARCKRYYLKKRASQKVYCSRGCGNATTAVVRTRERLAWEHEEKLRRAQAVMRKWTTARTGDDWKVFVSERQPDITPKFLTRAVNKGELKPPTKGKKP
jgi:hypothetical protein